MVEEPREMETNTTKMHTLKDHRCEECDFPNCDCPKCNIIKQDRTQPQIQLWWEDKDTVNGN